MSRKSDGSEFGIGLGGLAKMGDGVADAPEARHRDQLAAHQPPGAIFRIGQRLFDQGAVGGRNGLEHQFLVVVLELGNDMDRVVGLELADRGDRLGDAEFLDDLVADLVVKLGEDVGRKVGAQGLDDLAAFVATQVLQQIGDVGAVDRLEQGADFVGVVAIERLPDRRNHGLVEREALVDGGRFGAVFIDLGHRLRHRHCLLPGVSKMAPRWASMGERYSQGRQSRPIGRSDL